MHSAKPSPSGDARSSNRGHADWYGWQSILVDFAIFLLLVVCASLEFEFTGYMSFLFLVGSPLLHFLSHQKIKAAISLGLRIAGPILALLIFASDSSGNTPGLIGLVALIALPVGLLVAIGIDWFVLSWRRVEPGGQ